MGCFNVAFTEANLAAFCNEYKLIIILNKEPTCVKNYMSPSCIDLYLTNFPKGFESTLTIETDLPDFHELIVTVLKGKHDFKKNRFSEKLQVRLTLLDMNSLDFGSHQKCFIELL